VCVLGAVRRATAVKRRTAPSTHTTKTNFSKVWRMLPDGCPNGPTHVGAHIKRYFKCKL
jgi:hypothetical protein